MSSLRSASSLVQQHYSRLEGEGHRKGAEQQDLESGSQTSDLEPRGTDSCSIPGDGQQSMLHQSTSGERDNEGEGLQENQALEDNKKEESTIHQDGGPSEVEKRLHHSEEMLTVHSAVAQMLEFVLPFVDEIHQHYCSVKVVCDSYMCHSVKMEKRLLWYQLLDQKILPMFQLDASVFFGVSRNIGKVFQSQSWYQRNLFSVLCRSQL